MSSKGDSKIGSKAKPWVIAARPKTLPAGAGPVILGLALSYKMAPEVFSISVGLLTLVCALLLQISSNLINDYYDGISGLDNEDRLGPPRAVALGLISPQMVKKAFLCTLGLSFLIGLYLMKLGGIPIIIIGLSSLFFSWAYTGGPFPLSYLGLGEVFAFIFFGPVAVWGTWWLQSDMSTYFNAAPFIYGCGVGFISAALMGVNNLRDRLGDKEKGKITLATIFGDQKMRKLITLFLISSELAVFSLVRTPVSVLIGLIPLSLFYKSWWQLLGGSVYGKQLNNTLATVGKYLFIYSLTHSFIILFIQSTF